ncbi:MAG: Nramp family divalent metal transporter [Armatimonadetes bacterium]|nr:Nramp family divalent metal transporter [Armatimonadota bacterium]
MIDHQSGELLDTTEREKENAQASPEATGPATRPAPKGWRESLRSIGPGLIVVGAVVGSGELVVTTLLGAQVGFAVLWLIILSCAVKIIVQEQFAYYVITSGGTLLDALNRVPGLRIRGLSIWSWLLFVYFVLALLPAGGIIAMTASAASLMFGFGNMTIWIFALAALAALLIAGGNYGRIEKIFVFMVASFSFSQLIAVALTQRTEFAVSFEQILSGMKLHMPRQEARLAMSAFGITGIAASEVIFYTYWCLEKGYGRYVGKPDGTKEWRDRALGWISVLRKDVMLTAAVYTGITISFYLLGAAILHRTQPNIAKLDGMDVVLALSDIFTRSFGGWSFYIFMIGAFMVLYSTYVSASVSWPRVGTDFLEHFGVLRPASDADRNRWNNRLSIFLVIYFVAVYYLIKAPVALIVLGGTLSSLFLPILGFSAIYLFRKRTAAELRPGGAVRALLWISTLVITAVVAASLFFQLDN